MAKKKNIKKTPVKSLAEVIVSLEVEFDDPVRAPCAGQSMVIYDGDLLIAGGIIV